MLTDAGVHRNYRTFERRKYFADQTVNKKFSRAFEHGLTPIICCQRDLPQREQGITIDWIRQQIKIAFLNVTAEQAKAAVIAYEPIWAIGTEKRLQQSRRRSYAPQSHASGNRDEATAEAIRIQYGGSVNSGNAPPETNCLHRRRPGRPLKEEFGKIVNYK